MSTAWLHLPVVLSALLGIYAFTPNTIAQDADQPVRTYEEGRLTIADYKEDPPDGGTALDAVTTSDLKYDFSYQVYRAGRRSTAFIKEIKVLAIVKPDESWIRHPNDARLLDHEQGHFDITYAWALKARAHFVGRLKGRNRLTSTAGTPEAAIAGLHELMAKEMKTFFDGATAGHHEYDRLTAHGTRPGPQAEQREAQTKAIESLTQELKELE